MAEIDQRGFDTVLAGRAIFEGLTGIAMRHAGLPGPAYLHPDVARTT